MNARSPDAGHALTAASNFVLGSLVFIAEETEERRALGVSTGVVVRSPNGHAAVLTAKHVTEDAARDSKFGVGYAGAPKTHDDALYAKFLAPAPIDVALIVLTDEAQLGLRDRAIDLATIAEEPTELVGDKHWYVVAGYPLALMRRTLDHQRKTVMQDFGSVTYNCGFVREDGARLIFDWDEGIVNDAPPGVDSPPSIGTMEKLPDAPGMSGGPLWRFLPERSDRVWSPGTTGKLVGIQSAWFPKDREIIVEPAPRWRSWLEGALREMDDHLASR